MRACGDASQFPIPRATQELVVILSVAKDLCSVSSRPATTRTFHA
jgi:hypothetical protein